MVRSLKRYRTILICRIQSGASVLRISLREETTEIAFTL